MTMNKLYLGCHLSISGGYSKAAEEAISLGANTFQFFTRNPRGGSVKELNMKDIEKLKNIVEEHDFGPLLAHAPYTMNLCSDKEDVRKFARNVLREDLERISHLPDARFLFHPGSHVGQGPEQGIAFIVDALNDVIRDDEGPWVMLEGMSGKGSEIGRNFDEIGQIIQGVKHSGRLGVCIDTCHMHAAGYDVVNGFDGVLDEIEAKVGKGRIGGVHLNDDMNEFSSHKDRHEKIGQGTIGLDAICRIVSNERLRGLPFSLETPQDDNKGYAEEIRIIREKTGLGG